MFFPVLGCGWNGIQWVKHMPENVSLSTVATPDIQGIFKADLYFCVE